VPSRAQAWLRDELILALDLYLREGPNPGAGSAAELSGTLRSIPIEEELTESPRFRSPQSITYKLQNFVAIDPDRATTGFSHGGREDQNVWDEFAADPARLHEVALAIRANLGTLSPEDTEAEDPEVTQAEEGAVLTRIHRRRERSAKLRKTKKKRVIETTGRLACEACNLDFGERYGPRAEGFIECHHIIPLHSLKPGQRTKLDDLAVLCSNCHRVLHLHKPWLMVEELKELLETQSA
jgi:5-methylcytosine-specific restriction protein A